MTTKNVSDSVSTSDIVSKKIIKNISDISSETDTVTKSIIIRNRTHKA